MDTTQVSEQRLAAKRELLKAKLAAKRQALQQAQLPPLTAQPLEVGQRCALSFAQARLWLIDRMEGSSQQYTTPKALRVRGPFDVGVAERVFATIVERHEVLRTCLIEEGGEPVAELRSAEAFEIERHDLRSLAPDMREQRVRALLEELSARPFVLSSDLMLRVAYLDCSEAAEDPEGVLLLNMHHVASDGWSMGVLVNEFVTLYEAYTADRANPLPALSAQYSDYARWQREWASSPAIEQQVSYWQRQLDDVAPVHQLPLDRPRAASKAYEGAEIRGHLAPELTQGLQQLAARHGTTLYVVLHAAYALLLSRYSNSQDIVVGMPVANRRHRDVESLIGFFVNTLVLRTRTDFDDFAAYLDHVKEVNAQAQDNQDVPFEQLVELSGVPRTAQHTPLVQILLSMNNTQGSEVELADVRFSDLDAAPLYAKFDLTLNTFVSEGGVTLSWLYDCALFAEQRIRQLHEHLLRLLESIARATDATSVRQLAMLSADERRMLVDELNRLELPPIDQPLLHQRFEQHAARQPEQAALYFEDERWSYGELDAAANRLARELQSGGVAPGALVGLFAPRSPDLVIGLLAILKAGAAYVPLDPSAPSERLAYIVEDSGVGHVLVHPTLREVLQLPPAIEEIPLSGAATSGQLAGDGDEGSPLCPLDAAPDPEALAYVIYTSGSTGHPKGVLQTHGNVARLLDTTAADFAFGSDDVWTLFHSIAFDFSVWELWGALTYGGALLIPSIECTRDSNQFARLCAEHGVTVLNQTPSAFDAFTRSAVHSGLKFPKLRYVVFGGEALRPASLLPWWDHYAEEQPALINMYGITETTVHASYKRLSRADLGPSTIGRRLADQALYLLDAHGDPVPRGAVGEIHLGGRGLATGYLNRPTLTQERFIANPFATPEMRQIGCDRLYKSGDLARYTWDHELVYLGRNDDQVKINGYRIELGEVESQLCAQDAVSSAAVIARALGQDGTQAHQLIAYVVPTLAAAQEADLGERVRAALGRKVPSYMVPAFIVVLDELPRTVNGKVDRRALPLPDQAEQGHDEPRTPLERALCDIWCEVLELDVCGIHENFFECGGNSLLAMRAINRIQQTLDSVLHLVVMFDAPTVAEFAQYLGQHYGEALARCGWADSLSADAETDEPAQVQSIVDAHAQQRLHQLLLQAPTPLSAAPSAAKNRRAVFILSPPRSGSTLLRIMLAGHPDLFAPPELELLAFDDLRQRRDAFSGRHQFWRDGTLRALMACEQIDADTAQELLLDLEERKLPVADFYARLQAQLGDGLIIDKTPSYAYSIDWLQRAEALFEEPLYIHLVRHPRGMVSSFERAKLDQLLYLREHEYSTVQLAELLWAACHRNISQFLETIPAERSHRVHFEALVSEPNGQMEALSEFLGVPFHDALLQPYDGSDRRMTDGPTAESRMLGDVRFATHEQIDARSADAWHGHTSARTFPLSETCQALAHSFGYPSADEAQVAPPVSLMEAVADPAGSPLSFAQERLWFIDCMEGGGALYNVPCALRLQGAFDIEAAESALNQIVDRHEVLRTVYVAKDKGPAQIVRQEAQLTIAHVDLTGLDRHEQQRRVEQFLAEDAARPFDLSADLALRAAFLDLGDSEGVFTLCMHHIASDGWSIGILMREFCADYAAAVCGDAPQTPPLALQYRQYASWQREWLDGERLEQQFAYWEAQLADAPAVHTLPTDYSRPAVKQSRGAVVSGRLSPDEAAALNQLANEQGVTLFVMIHAALALLLSRHSAQQDIVIGTASANRRQVELEALIGCFVNTLVLRTSTDFSHFNEYLAHVKEVNQQAQAHQDVPFERLVERLEVPRSTSHAPIYQITLTLNESGGVDLRLPEVTCEALGTASPVAKYDLEINAQADAQGITIDWLYDEALFACERMERLSGDLIRLFRGLIGAPNAALRDLPVLAEDEVHYLVHELNRSEAAYPQQQLIHELFEAQAARRGDAPAVLGDGETLSYGELNAQANQMARWLRERGVGRGSIVGVCVERSVNVMLGILATLKAGASYVPLDPSYPPQRLEYILQDTDLEVIITQASLMADLPVAELQVALVDEDIRAAMYGSYASDNLPRVDAATSSADPAYVIYTSGSTGTPKGVQVPHRGAINMCLSQSQWFAATQNSRVLQFASFGFDASVSEWMMALINGAPLYICTQFEREDPARLEELLLTHQITHATIPPALLHHLSLAHEYVLECLIVAGEACDEELAWRWAAQYPTFNAYGPTETSVCASIGRVVPNEPLHIGKPIANTQLYVLDGNGALCPRGVAGELYIGGDGLAIGYLNRAELTAQKFVDDPFSERAEARLYRTGDLVRWSDAGNLQFLGRADDQIKLRGLRIEPAEIEQHLADAQGVQSAVVLVRESADGGDKRLVAYVTAESAGADPRQLTEQARRYLRSNVPDYMVPSAFVLMDRFPLTHSGKVDKKALPEPDDSVLLDTYVAPESAAEQALVEIWAKLLQLPPATIGVQSKFFELGGHSLLAVRLASDIRSAFGVELAVRAVFDHQSIRELATLIEQAESSRLPELTLAPPDAKPSLSFAQTRLWLIDQIDPGGHQYNMPAALQLDGPLDVSALQRAFSSIVERHQVLRTVFRSDDAGEPMQVIQGDYAFSIDTDDLSHLQGEEQEQAVLERVYAEARRPFDLAADLMLRVRLLRRAATSHVMMITMHHIASDGWSMGVLVRELSAFYRAYLLDEPSSLPPVAIQYSDYSHWQNSWLQGEELDRYVAFWVQRLRGLPQLHDLPLDRPRPPVQSFEGAHHMQMLGTDVLERLKALAHRYDATLYMVLNAAFAVLLSRYSNQQDIVVGTPIANRDHTALENLVGFFVNTLVLRTQVDPTESFEDLLLQCKSHLLGAYEHQQLPFERLVDELQPDRSLSYPPLFQVVLALQNAGTMDLELPELTLHGVGTGGSVAKYDLSLTGTEKETGLHLAWAYATALFDATTIERMATHFNVLLEAALEDPTRPVGELPLLTARERQQQLSDYHSTCESYPLTRCIHQLFIEQAERTPDATAISFEGESLTYGALAQAAGDLAQHLLQANVRSGSLVGLLLDRSIDQLVSMLAVWQVGAAYLPLDPTHPTERLRYVLDDARVTLVLSHAATIARTDGDVVPLEQALLIDELPPLTGAPAPLPAVSVHTLAYVLYTSGSTGRPKGALVEHIGLTNLAFALRDILDWDSGAARRRWALNASMTFDASLQGLVMLAHGVQLDLVPSAVRMDPTRLLAFCALRQSDFLDCTPAVASELARLAQDGLEMPAVSLIIGGEAIDASLWQRLVQLSQRVGVPYYNVYGSTETTVDNCWAMLRGEQPIIGQCIANQRAYVLSPSGELQPPGAVGELYIGGVGIARGYLNRHELTAQRFVADPFSDDPQARLYRTGDLARWLPGKEARLEFIARADHQVKVRGYRIEPGEVESALHAQASVSEAVVVARDEPKRLVAYVVGDGAEDKDASGWVSTLRKRLEQVLPDYMVPSAFVALDRLPLSGNGKVDRSALPAPEAAMSSAAYLAPTTQTARGLVEIWSQLLGTSSEHIGMSSRFFELGGHSLLAVRLVSEIRARFNVEVAVRDVFVHQRLGDLARCVDGASKTGMPELVPAPQDVVLLPSFAQQRLWLIDQIEPGGHQYNMPMGLRLQGPLQSSALERALARIVERHAVLRTVLKADENGEPYQVVRDDVRLALAVRDLTHLSEDEQRAEVERAAVAQAHAPFSLDQDLMLRGELLRCGAQDHVLLLTMHHIASDGWSGGVLVGELSTLYRAYAAGEPDPLPPLAIQYADYAHWQRSWLSGEVLDAHVGYWHERLKGLPQVHALPLDRPRPAVQSVEGAQHLQVLGPELLAGLNALAERHDATLFMVLQAALAVLLSRYSNEQDIVMGTPVANRDHAALAPMVGFFVNTLVLRTDLSGDPTFEELLDRCREYLLGAYDHQQVPFERLVDELAPKRSLSYSPLFQVMLVMQNLESSEFALADLEVSSTVSPGDVAKFELTLAAGEDESGLVLGWQYATALFDATTIARMAEHFEVLLNGVLAQPATPVTRLPLLHETESVALTAGCNRSAAAFRIDVCMHELFEAHATATPQALALVAGDVRLTYGQLNERANQLAHELIERGVGPEVLVGLCVGRSETLIIATLAILKAGGAFLPIDRSHPVTRVRGMLDDAQAFLLLTESSIHEHFAQADSVGDPALGDRMVLLLDQWQARDTLPTHNPDRHVLGLTPQNLAYAMYTSGSTGLPKGVLVPHAGVVNLSAWIQRAFDTSEDSRVLHFATSIFDVSVWELMMALGAGASLYLADEPTRQDPTALGQFMAEHAITHATLPPALLRFLPPSLDYSLQALVVAGEACDQQFAWEWAERYPLYNAYGPTEITVISSMARVVPGERITIGTPIANTQLYVLDGHGAPVPVGVIGELYVGGAGVVRGYQGRDDLTAQRFLSDPYREGGRMYRTGDLVRRLPSGEVEFIGRADHQVKIRGYRIEPGEIEAALQAQAGVSEAVVVARDEPKRLVAYVVGDGSAPARSSDWISSLRAGLERALPDYMVPSAFVALESLPLSSTGKLDRGALPAPDGAALSATYVAPTTQTARGLVEVWSELLGVTSTQIGMASRFFELGGHSLLAVRLVSEIRSRFDVEVAVRDVFVHQRLGDLARRVDGASRTGMPELVPAPQDAVLLPSFAQQRLWLIDQIEPGGHQYNMPLALRLRGPLDRSALGRALARIVERHAVLRTVLLADENGEPYQVVRGDVSLALPVRDLRPLSEAERHEEVERLAAFQARTPFALDTDLMLRAELLCTGGAEHVLLLTMHHIASDGWSAGVLVGELSQLYQAYVRGESDPLPPLPIQYADYAHWQRSWLSGDVLDAHVAYWHERLDGLPQVHALPLDRPRPQAQSFVGAKHAQVIGADVLRGLNDLAQRHDATLFMVLQAALAVLLSRYSNERDIVMGTPVANRDHASLEPLVGFFVNTLVLRTDLSGDPSFEELLDRCREYLLGAYDHQQVPFERLVDELAPQRSLSYSPLFQVMLVLQNFGAAQLSLPALEVSGLAVEDEVAKFDLTITMVEGAGELSIAWQYATALFDESTIASMAEHFAVLLESIVTEPSADVTTLALLPRADQIAMIEAFNRSEATYPSGACAHELFEAHAAANPDALAVTDGDRALTYSALNQQANQLAHHLLTLGVGPDVLVGLCVERSPALLVGVLAVLKAGGAFVPIDPTYPSERVQHIVNDADLALLITEDSPYQLLEAVLPKAESATQVLILDDWSPAETLPTHNPDPRALGLQPHHLAYAIYTSGSTGMPKGVLVPHRGTVNMSAWLQATFATDARSRVLHFASIAFDASVWELMMALGAGAGLYLVDEQMRHDPEALGCFMAKHRITHATLPPTLLRFLPLSLDYALQAMVVAGEACDPQLAWEWAERYPLYNAYGPTETSVCASMARVVPGERITIGQPIANAQLYVLDAHRSPVPVGVVGELYVGGAGVARGYQGRDDLTAERFLDDPYRQGARMYRTGDLVRRLASGDVEFIGRADHQVKVRGHRIEPGEIEAVLKAQAGVSEMVVVARDEPKRLVAYVVGDRLEGDGSSDWVSTLRAGLERALPDYMVPSAFVVLDSLPLSSNGKVDRSALPAPDGAVLPSAYVAPTTETARGLVEVWSRLLGIPSAQIGMSSRFFELGGHSLLAVRLVSEIRSRFDVELAVRDVFVHQRLGDLARRVDGASRTGMPELVPAPQDAALLPSFAQQRLWLIDQIEPGGHQYNMPMALRLQGRLDRDALERALVRIVERHDVLRTVLQANDDGEPYQRLRDDVRLRLTVRDLSTLSDAEQRAEVERLALAQARAPFALDTDLMLRAELLCGSAEDHVLLLTMHHIASDGWSVGLLVGELSQLYQAYVADEPDPLPPLAIQYADYAHWQRSWLSGEVLDAHVGYWHERLAGLPQVHALPLDRPRPAVQPLVGAQHAQVIGADVLGGLNALAQRHDATLFMVLQAALAVLLSRYSNEQDIVMGTPVANRDHASLEPLVGFFVNTLVLRTDLSGDPSFEELLGRCREYLLGAYDHQQVPFERLVDELAPQRSLSYSPLFQVMLVLQNFAAPTLSLPALEVSGLGVSGEVAKFDLTITMVEDDGELRIAWQYATALFDASTIARMAEHFGVLLERILAAPTSAVMQLPLLTRAQARTLVVDYNAQTQAPPVEHLAPELIERQAAFAPDVVAVSGAGQSLTYGQLNRRANQLARYLLAQGVNPSDRVILCAERSPDLLVGLLGIWKAGAAYVPLDPQYPRQRLELLIDDVMPAFAVVSSAQADLMGDVLPNAVPMISLDGDAPFADCAEHDVTRAESGLDPLGLAYVIYTSGSTGTPKGVLVEHGAVANLALNLQDILALDGASTEGQGTWALNAPVSFDASLKGLLMLCFGLRVHLLDDQVRRDPRELVAECEREGVTHMDCTPAMAALLCDRWRGMDYGCVPQLLVGGEAIDPHLWAQLATLGERSGRQMWNVYGPTEATVNTCWAPIELGRDRVLGTLLGGVQGYVVSPAGQLQPPGVVGELYIGGRGLARGYHARDALTAERFVRPSFADADTLGAASRLYRSGDLVCWSTTRPGMLEYVGRCDEQLKVRGYRVEPGEVEAALHAHPAVEDCVVLGRDEPLRLVAYVVPTTPEGAAMGDALCAVLTGFLEDRLPAYLVPSALVVMDALPLTHNAKVDRQALPAPDGASSQEVHEAPDTDTERALVPIWAELLGVDPALVGKHSNFFSLGGHSLGAVQLMAQIAKHFGVDVPVRTLFAGASLARLAEAIDEHDEEDLEARYGVEPFTSAVGELPVFVAPALGMMTISYRQLASQLDQTHRVLALSTPGIDESVPEDSPLLAAGMEARLDYWLEAIRENQPAGPYRLVGHSFGGCTAFELARRLEAMGETVQLVLLESILGADADLGAAENDADVSLLRAGMTWRRSPEEMVHKYVASLPRHLNERELNAYTAAVEQQVRLLNAYRPSGPLRGEVYLLQADDGLGRFPGRDQVLEHIQEQCDQPLRVRSCPGTHLSIVDQLETARCLQRELL